MNVFNTFVEIAPDCPVQTAAIPPQRGDKPTIAQIEYELLTGHPYGLTLEELKFEVHLRHKGIAAQGDEERGALWGALFAKPHARMRASPLTKQYGWGAHYNAAGKIALFPVEGEEYRRLAGDPALEHCLAMRSKRG